LRKTSRRKGLFRVSSFEFRVLSTEY
jgi:hypothetical protein